MKSSKLFHGILLFVSASMVLAACNTGAHKGFKKTESGIYYKIKSQDNTDTTRVALGTIVSLDLKYGFTDSVFFNSKDRPGEMRFPLQESKYEGDFYEALQIFNQGDSGTFILKAGPFFMQTVGQPTLPEYVKEDDDVYFDVFIKSVMTQQQLDEEAAARAEELRLQEAGTIAAFVAERGIAVPPDTSGFYYIEKTKGKGKSPQADDYATVHFTVFRLNGEKLFSTRDGGEPLDFQVGSQFENDGFQRVVKLMKSGGTAEAVVPSSLAFGAQGMGEIVPPFSPLFYELELIGIMTQAEFDKKQQAKEAQRIAQEANKEQQEGANMEKYLKENNINGQIQPSGLVYVETQAGAGPKPAAGQKIKVHYTGKLLDGTKFDSSVDRGEPFEFTLGQGQVIQGWDEGIALMNEGGKATLIIPSKIGYGASGAGNIIPPFATLVFDVELVEIVKN